MPYVFRLVYLLNVLFIIDDQVKPCHEWCTVLCLLHVSQMLHVVYFMLFRVPPFHIRRGSTHDVRETSPDNYASLNRRAR